MMKNLTRTFQKALWIAFCLMVLGSIASAQGKKTIILVRHAEKETSQMTDGSDPELTAAGKERAERLVKRIGKFRPGAVYVSDYKRTRETGAPLATKRHVSPTVYDPKKPQELLDTINASRIKRVLVIGHSNTIPPLANLLIKKQLFRDLEDSEYSTIWIIRSKNGKVTSVELLDY